MLNNLIPDHPCLYTVSGELQPTFYLSQFLPVRDASFSSIFTHFLDISFLISVDSNSARLFFPVIYLHQPMILSPNVSFNCLFNVCDKLLYRSGQASVISCDNLWSSLAYNSLFCVCVRGGGTTQV